MKPYTEPNGTRWWVLQKNDITHLTKACDVAMKVAATETHSPTGPIAKVAEDAISAFLASRVPEKPPE